MKTMTCKQLGGACDMKFSANTFDEIAQLSQTHGKEMFQINDNSHIIAMNEMNKLMQNNDAMSQWFDAKKLEFEILEED
ncbi:MAG: putative small metal-binding protein [Brevundimonas sp.]|jgi:predicted small metal-binding protein|tara:strand:- start:45 stop:281 length:237 start_codon:yes stop_codon:yes gene_type:complete